MYGAKEVYVPGTPARRYDADRPAGEAVAPRLKVGIVGMKVELGGTPILGGSTVCVRRRD